MKRVLLALLLALATNASAGDTTPKTRTVVSVSMEVPGATSEAMEAKVTAPLEATLGRISGTRFLRSSSSPGRSVIEFEVQRAQACEASSRLTLALDDIRKNAFPGKVAEQRITARPDIGC